MKRYMMSNMESHNHVHHRGKELLFRVLRHENVGNDVPWVPFAGIHAGKLKKVLATELLTNENKLLQCLIEVNRIYQPDGQPVIFDLQIEAEILGCGLKWADKAPPSVTTHPLHEKPIIPTKIPQKTEGRLPLVLNTMRKLKVAIGDKTALFGLICGPLTLASHLRGTDLFTDLIRKPDYANQLLNYTTQIAIKMAEYYIEAGMDVIAVVDPVISQISPRHFKNFLLKPFQTIFKYIKDQKRFSSLFVCGDATKNLEIMGETAPDSIFVDENIDMVYAKKVLEPFNIVLGGNIPLTTIMLYGSQQDNMKYVVDLLSKLGTKDVIIAPGCDMPYDVPPDNTIGVLQAVQEPEIIRKALLDYQSVEEKINIFLPQYEFLKKPLVEVFTLDSATCAACGYMMNVANDAKAHFKEKIDLVEYKFIHKESIARAKKMKLTHLPALLLNGKLEYSSIIPEKEELFEKIQKLLK